MEFDDVETVDDAKQFLLERGTVEREELHFLCVQLGADARRELLTYVKETGIVLTGEHGR